MEKVEHLVGENRFVLRCGNAEAVLQYQLIAASSTNTPAIIDFYRTYVPPEFRGKGLAEALVRAGLKWAKEQGYELRASCWYVAKFIR